MLNYNQLERRLRMKNIIFQQCQTVVDDTLYPISNISNILAILYHEFAHINWAGLYYCDNENQECILGPFQGKVACTKIPYHKGVVGTCAASKKMIVVDNVHQFDGHIACDHSSKSELVIPLIYNNELLAILDIDSDQYNNFDQDIVETILEISYILSSLVSKERK